jgi:hypothetical protein
MLKSAHAMEAEGFYRASDAIARQLTKIAIDLDKNQKSIEPIDITQHDTKEFIKLISNTLPYQYADKYYEYKYNKFSTPPSHIITTLTDAIAEHAREIKRSTEPEDTASILKAIIYTIQGNRDEYRGDPSGGLDVFSTATNTIAHNLGNGFLDLRKIAALVSGVLGVPVQHNMPRGGGLHMSFIKELTQILDKLGYILAGGGDDVSGDPVLNGEMRQKFDTAVDSLNREYLLHTQDAQKVAVKATEVSNTLKIDPETENDLLSTVLVVDDPYALDKMGWERFVNKVEDIYLETRNARTDTDRRSIQSLAALSVEAKGKDWDKGIRNLINNNVDYTWDAIYSWVKKQDNESGIKSKGDADYRRVRFTVLEQLGKIHGDLPALPYEKFNMAKPEILQLNELELTVLIALIHRDLPLRKVAQRLLEIRGEVQKLSPEEQLEVYNRYSATKTIHLSPNDMLKFDLRNASDQDYNIGFDIDMESLPEAERNRLKELHSYNPDVRHLLFEYIQKWRGITPDDILIKVAKRYSSLRTISEKQRFNALLFGNLSPTELLLSLASSHISAEVGSVARAVEKIKSLGVEKGTTEYDTLLYMYSRYPSSMSVDPQSLLKLIPLAENTIETLKSREIAGEIHRHDMLHRGAEDYMSGIDAVGAHTAFLEPHQLAKALSSPSVREVPVVISTISDLINSELSSFCMNEVRIFAANSRKTIDSDDYFQLVKNCINKQKTLARQRRSDIEQNLRSKLQAEVPEDQIPQALIGINSCASRRENGLEFLTPNNLDAFHALDAPRLSNFLARRPWSAGKFDLSSFKTNSDRVKLLLTKYWRLKPEDAEFDKYYYWFLLYPWTIGVSKTALDEIAQYTEDYDGVYIFDKYSQSQRSETTTNVAKVVSLFDNSWKNWKDKFSTRTGEGVWRLARDLPVAPAKTSKYLRMFLLNNYGNRNERDVTMITKSWAILPVEMQQKLAQKIEGKSWGELVHEIEDLRNAKIYETIKPKDYNFAREYLKHAELSDYDAEEVDPTDYAKAEQHYLNGIKTPLPEWATGVFQSGKLIGRFLPREDTRSLYIGEQDYSHCCQRLGDAGEYSAIHSVTSPEGAVFVVEDKTGRIIAQSWVWEKNDIVVFDNIEGRSPNGGYIAKVYINDVQNIYNQAAQAMTGKRVIVGPSGTKIPPHSTWSSIHPQERIDTSHHVYSDAKNAQWLINDDHPQPLPKNALAPTHMSERSYGGADPNWLVEDVEDEEDEEGED